MTPAPTGYPTFARFAYPPNELGYCGPSDIEVLFNEQSSGQLATARAFDGAWPYLTALADATGHDPLDDEVVRSGMNIPYAASQYLTTDDQAWEINFDHQYQIYENLTAVLELGYINLHLDSDTWTDHKTDDAWKAQVMFQYSF